MFFVHEFRSKRQISKFPSVQCVEVVLGYVVGGGDYNSVKLLKVEEVELIADDPGLQLCYKTVFDPWNDGK